ncbi:CPBP family intramembrane glutamic endopeptidase [Enterococcus sp. LJL99]
MSLKNLSLRTVSLSTIILYGFVFFSPYLLQFFPKQAMIPGTTIVYILGAILMIGLYSMNQSKTLVEEQAKLTSPVFIFLLGFGGIFLAMIIQGVVFSIETVITGVKPDSENTKRIIEVILMNPLFILATTIGGPIMEEFVFRRSLIGLSEPYIGFWFSAIVSSSLFSLIHQDGHFFVYFFMGLFFAILYKVTGKIWTSIIAHCGMNTVVVVVQLLVHAGVIQVPN